jgi:hypothetical protein
MADGGSNEKRRGFGFIVEVVKVVAAVVIVFVVTVIAPVWLRAPLVPRIFSAAPPDPPA